MEKCFNLWQVIKNKIRVETVEEINPRKSCISLSPFCI